jgi:hypothetical protein
MKRLVCVIFALLFVSPAMADDARDFRAFVQLVAAASTNKNFTAYTKYDGRIEAEYVIGENTYHVRMSVPPYSVLSRFGKNRPSKRKLDISIRDAHMPSRIEILIDAKRDGQIDRGFVIESGGYGRKTIWPAVYAATRYRDEIKLSVAHLSK